MADQAEDYLGEASFFSTTEATWSISPPPPSPTGWIASPLQVITIIKFVNTPFIDLGEVSCPRTQQSAPAMAQTRTTQSLVQPTSQKLSRLSLAKNNLENVRLSVWLG